MSEQNSQYKINPADVDNELFLKALFRELYPEAWVGCATNPKGNFVDRALPWLNMTTSCWFASCALTPGAKGREDIYAAYGVVQVIDDVGTKLPMEIASLAPTPTYVVETSPGNYQFGYRIAPAETDMQRWDAFRRLLKESKFGKGADGSGRASYWRLPVGGYHKKPGVKTRLDAWSPEVSYTLDELARLLGFELTQENVSRVAARKTVEQAAPVSDKVLREDPGFRMFEALGAVHSGQKADGWIDVRCPNEHLHTSTGANDNAGYVVNGGGGSPDFKCFHAHCQGLRWKGGVEDLFFNGDRYKDQYRRFIFEVFDETTEAGKKEIKDAEPKSHEEFAEAELMSRIQALLPTEAKAYRDIYGGFRMDEFDIKSNKIPPMKPTIFSRFYRNMASAIAAEPGIGKSLYSCAFALAIAWQDLTPLMAGDWKERRGGKIDWTGDVILVANEDSLSEVELRLAASIKHHGLKPENQKHRIYIVARSQVKLLGLDPKTQKPVVLCQDLLRAILSILERPERPQIAAVFVDTLSSAMGPGLDENSNSNMQLVMDYLNLLSLSLFTSMTIVHHATKAGAAAQNKTLANQLRGGGSIGGAIRAGIGLAKLEPEDCKRLRIKEGSNAAARAIKSLALKGNYEPDTADALGYYTKVSVDMPVRDPRDGSILTQSVGVLQELIPVVQTETEKLQGDLDLLKDARDALPVGAHIGLGNKSSAGVCANWNWASAVLGCKAKDAEDRVKALEDAGVVRVVEVQTTGKHLRRVIEILDEEGGITVENGDNSEGEAPF